MGEYSIQINTYKMLCHDKYTFYCKQKLFQIYNRNKMFSNLTIHVNVPVCSLKYRYPSTCIIVMFTSMDIHTNQSNSHQNCHF